MYEGTALEFVTFLTSITSIQYVLSALKKTVHILYGRMQLHPGHQSGSLLSPGFARLRSNRVLEKSKARGGRSGLAVYLYLLWRYQRF